MSHGGRGAYHFALPVEIAAVGLRYRAPFEHLRLHGGRKLPLAGHFVRPADAVQHHVGPFQQSQRFVDLLELAHFVQRLFVQKVGQMHHPMMSAQPPGDLTGDGVGLRFQRAADTAPGRNHHHVHGRTAGQGRRHLTDGRAAGHSQRKAALQEASQPRRGGAPHLVKHVLILVRISRNHADLRAVPAGGQRRLQLRQSPQFPAEQPRHGENIAGRLRQAHSGSIQADQTMLLEQRRHRADFPLRQVQPCRQLTAAHGLQRADAFQHQRPAFDFLRQIRGEPFDQGKIVILHSPLAILVSSLSVWDIFCPA